MEEVEVMGHSAAELVHLASLCQLLEAEFRPL